MLLARFKTLSFASKKQSYILFFAARIKAIYLAYVDDRAIIDCFFEHQFTGPLFNIKIKFEVDF